MSEHPMAVADPRPAGTEKLLARARQLGEEEMKKLLAHTPKSARLYDRARRILPYGVVSSFQKQP
ncbi:MAG: hypothetical protein ACREMO_11500, partial [Gemmatimonadales bacterium]